MSAEKKQPFNEQKIANPVERLEEALGRLGFALEQKEKQAQKQDQENKARLKLLSERVEHLESRLTALLGDTSAAKEE
ncbi:hypothetical protein GS501_01065 [Saccharibacter sp. 17.LH.SD]|uniref:hypothetical protein n=1 Tax=Saccharibacter sp. 17.LH.SD TaxID=2689393 RepID=UPI0013700C05|nr:hypothetical protein [Saccharibacter sp. 17.LH.SD]MXV43665.1 hypothetical protein [Saccharibacter sp. 17.LH.SD]